MLRLPYYVSLFVPSTVDHNVPNPMLHNSMMQHVAETMAKLFGGATVTDATGFYLADNGETIQEKIAVVRSNCSMEQFEQNKPAMVELAEFVCDTMRQECVGIDFNGTFSLVDAKKILQRQAA